MENKKIQLAKSEVFFDELSHTYFLNGKQLQGITGTLIERAYPNQYDSVPESVLNHAAERGNNVHEAIENGVMGKQYDASYENIVSNAKELLAKEGLTVIAVEYVVTDGENYASPIDMVACDKDGNIYIIDIKTTYKMFRDNVTLQTNIYQRFFKILNPTLNVAGRMCLWMRVDDSKKITGSGLFDLDEIPSNLIDDLIEADINDKEFDVSIYYGDLPKKVADVQKYLRDLHTLIEEKTKEMEEIKKGLLDLMAAHNLKKYTSKEGLTLTRILGCTKMRFDSTKFKKDHPDLYEEYQKETKQNESIRISFK